MSYLPDPPNAWSRVLSNINCIAPLVPPLGKYDVYVPLTKQTIPPGLANYQNQVLYKGNILQYKNNSANFSKKQQYSQIAKGFGNSRKKTYATQSTTYTNPNSSSLYRTNFTNIPIQNQIPGQPGNPSGPYQPISYNPYNCNTDFIREGGALMCGSLADPCTNNLIKQGRTQLCAPITSSGVPGFGVRDVTQVLCWNKKLSVFIPRQRRTMSNSGNKWPTNYKIFTSATTPFAPVLSIELDTFTSVKLTWKYKNNSCVPISKFLIYQNNALIRETDFDELSTIISDLTPGDYTYYIVGLSDTIESPPSNTVNITIV